MTILYLLVCECSWNILFWFVCFFRYIYTGSVLLDTDCVLGMMVLADKYNFVELKSSCCEFMMRNLATEPNKAIQWHQCAKACNLHLLEVSATLRIQ